MDICELCRSIPFQSLAIIGKGYNRRPVADTDLVHISGLAERITENEDQGFPYHANLAGLQASAESCRLCFLVSTGINMWVDRFRYYEQTDALFREKCSRKEYDIPFNERLWLGKRPSGSPGFLVVARHPGRAAAYVLTGVGLSVPRGHLLAAKILQRPMESDSGSPHSLQLAASLLKQCCETHNKCRPTDSQLPSRVLDIGAPGDVIKLVDGMNKSGEYACLSYCWGQSVPFTTTKATLEERKAGFEVSLLPKTLIDTVKLTGHLNIKYLWVDSLCICQDDEDEWVTESARMMDVYSQAHVVIAAEHGSDSSKGLFHHRKLHSATEVNIPSIGDGIHASLLNPMVEWAPDHPRMSDPLSNRAWTFQEGILPRRCLSYNSRYIYFECNQGIVIEGGAGSPKRWYGSLVDLNGSDIPSTTSSSDDSALNRVLQKWYNLVWLYGKRDLTKRSDKLPAMSGLAKLIGQALLRCTERHKSDSTDNGAQYIAGLWSGALVQGLSWRGDGSYNSTVVEEFIAPSWSWASYGGTADTLARPGWKDIAQIRHWEVELKSENNPFGEVVREGTWLSIEGPLVKLAEDQRTTLDRAIQEEKWKKTGMTPAPYIRTKFCTTYTTNYIDFDDARLKDSGSWTSLDLYGLVLGGWAVEMRDKDESKSGTHQQDGTSHDDDGADETEGGKEAPVSPLDRCCMIVVTPSSKDGVNYGIKDDTQSGWEGCEMRRVGCVSSFDGEGLQAILRDKGLWKTVTLV